MPSHNHDFDERDLSEAPRLAKDSQPRGLIVGGCIAVVLFLALLAYGSLPELSPQEIVAMEGYAGEQPTRHIFNIHSLEQDAAEAQQPEQQQEQLTESGQEMIKPEMAESENPVVATINVLPEPEVVEPVVAATVEPVTVETAQPQPVEIVEVQPEPVVEAPAVVVAAIEPASDPVVTPVATRTESSVALFGTAREDRVVAAMATTPTIDEASDTVVVSSVAAIEPVPIPAGSAAPAPSVKGKLLPLRSVLEDFTELKASPTRQSKTLLSLGRGVVVTAFERHGKWIHIGTNDGSSITGYVLETSLGRVGSKNSG